ncbi:MAG: hypothetical protein HC904_14270 [Blastochloris sp.]|nr:hypothetical protein [Blastochloris sp.]
MCVQMSIAYFFAAGSKLNEPFLSGAILADFLQDGFLYEKVPGFAWLSQMPQVMVLGVGSVLLEYFLMVGLWLKRLRTYAICLGLGFHGSIVLCLPWGALPGITAFSLMMAGIYLLYGSWEKKPGAGGAGYTRS